MPPIQTKRAHAALTQLIGELDKADLTGLRRTAREERTSHTEDAWVDTLRRAVREIEEWCPNPDQFTIDAPPKER